MLQHVGCPSTLSGVERLNVENACNTQIIQYLQGCIGGGARGGSAPLVKILWQVGRAQPPLLLYKIAYNVNVCQLCDHKF